MPEIRLELPGDLVRKLDTEVELLGFDDREEYLRWIVGNRASIEGGTERDQLLSEYQSRVEELEAQLEAHDGSGEPEEPPSAGESEETPAEASDAGAGAARSRATDGSGVRVKADQPAASAPGKESDGRDAASSTQSTFADSNVADSNVADSNAADSNIADSTGGGDGSNRAGSSADSRGVDVDAASANDDGSQRERAGGNVTDDGSGGVDDASPAESAVEAAAQSTVAELQGNFRPERVERFEDESLGSQANQLQGVEGERLDEFARRAVAKTRKRLGREPSTGLDYRSQTRISRASSDVRPGEDLVDLDSLDVPGRSEETMAPRRDAVGAALAYLRDVGRAKRGDFLEELFDEYPAGYDSKSGWWRCIKRGLKDAPVVDGGDGSRVWRYVPPGSREGELLGSGPKRVVDPE